MIRDPDDFMWLADPVAPRPGLCDRCRTEAAMFGYMLTTRALSLCFSCAQKFEADVDAGGGGVDGLVHAYAYEARHSVDSRNSGRNRMKGSRP